MIRLVEDNHCISFVRAHRVNMMSVTNYQDVKMTKEMGGICDHVTLRVILIVLVCWCLTMWFFGCTGLLVGEPM